MDAAMTKTERKFMAAMHKHGLQPAEAPIADGKIHRIHDQRDKHWKKDLWYVLHDDGRPNGWFGHHSRMQYKQKWMPRHKAIMTPEELEKFRQMTEQRQLANSIALQAIRAKCRETAVSMLDKACDAAPSHPYLVRKNVKTYGIKQLGEILLIPLYKDDALTGLQRIMPDGEKRFLKGSDTTGAYFVIAGDDSAICIAEGYATGATIHELTGYTVFLAFNCGNLGAVARKVRAMSPEGEIIICADNDRFTDGNPGLSKAKLAARAIGAKLAIPEFLGSEGTDFNDLAAIYGSGGGLWQS